MECNEGSGGSHAGQARRAAATELQEQRKEKKRARELLSAAREEFKKKSPMTEKARRDARGKSTLQSYFTSSRNAGSGAPLMLQLDSESIDAGSSEEDSAALGLASLRGGSVSVDTAAPGSSSGSGETVVLSSKSPLICLPTSSEEVDNAGLKEVPNSSEGEDEEVESPPKKGKKLKSESQQRYDRHRKFQTLWAAKLPWAEGIMASDGILQMVKCKPCSVIDRKPCIMAPKSDTLFKHDGKRIAKKDMPHHKVKKGEQYVAAECRHKKNMKLYAARPPATVLEQVNHCTTIEARKKRVQFASIFQILRDGRPMLDFESRYPLYKFLNVPDLPNAHWCDNSGWVMASYMYKIVTAEIRKLIQSARFLALSVDEVTTADNSSYLSLHCYVVLDWVRVPLLVSLQKVECPPNAENLTKLIMESFAEGGGLDTESVARKLVSFGADGASTMQGCRAGVTTMVHDNFAPFCHGIHCVAHRCNLAFKALQSMGVFGAIERVLTVTYAYFCKSPKRFAEFKHLAELTETKGLKMLRNVETRWVSLIEPLRRLLSEYRTLIYKMTADLSDNDKAEAYLVLLLDPYTLLGMCALLPLMEAIDQLVTFAQKRDVFICDFVAAVKICQASLYTLYQDRATAYSTDEFWSFNNLLDCSHEQIHIKWITDLNDGSAVLSFVCFGEQIHAEHNGAPVDRDIWATLLARVKVECTGAAAKLISELDARFPAQHVMNAMGILYPQYWVQGLAEENFDKHLRTLMDAYGHGKVVDTGETKHFIQPLINREQIMSQRSLFKTCMKSNARAALMPPFDMNPLTRVWRVLDGNSSLCQSFSEFIKLAELAVTHVIGSVEDERLFSALKFVKSKLRASLDDHLQVAVGMYAQRIFTLESFPYPKVFDDWNCTGGRGRYLTHA